MTKESDVSQALSGVLRVRIERLVQTAPEAEAEARTSEAGLYCTCEVQGKPNTATRTATVFGELCVEWQHTGNVLGASPEAKLVFSIMSVSRSQQTQVRIGAPAPSGLQGRAELAVADVIAAGAAGYHASLPVALPRGRTAVIIAHVMSPGVASLEASPGVASLEASSPRAGEASSPREAVAGTAAAAGRGRRASFRLRVTAPGPGQHAMSASMEEEEKEISLEEEMRQELAIGNVDDAMLFACYAGSASGVRECLARGAAPLSWDNRGRTTALFAILSGSKPALEALIEADTHGEMSGYFFDSDITADGCTLMMLALLHGYPEICDFLINARGAEPRLVGKAWRFLDNGGLNAPLNNWMEFLPELRGFSTLPPLHPLVMASGRLVDPPEPSEEHLAEARARRLTTRGWIRQRLVVQRSAARADPDAQRRSAQAGQEALSHKTDPVHSPRAAKRDALRVPTTATDGHHDVLGTLHRNSPRDGAAADEGRTWSCGICSKTHRSPPWTESRRVVPCEGCGAKNLLRLGGGESPRGRGASQDAPSDAEEVDENVKIWDNTANEFMAEKTVKRHMNVLSHSILWNLGKTAVRDLLAVVKVVSMSKDDTVFREGTDLSHAYLLTDGQVEVRRGSGRLCTVVGTSKGAELLDTRSYMSGGDHGDFLRQHQVSATVVSDTALLYTFSSEDLDNFCKFSNARDLVLQASTATVMQKLKAMTLIMHHRQRNAIQGAAEPKTFQMKRVLIGKGATRPTMAIIVQGSLFISNPSGSGGKVVHVGRTPGCKDIQERLCHPEVDASEAKFWVVGLRSLLFESGSYTTIAVDSEYAVGWEFNVNKCNKSLERELVDEGADLKKLLLQSTVIESLHGSACFKGLKLNDPRLRQLVGRAHLRDMMENELVVLEGSQAAEVIVLIEGSVQVNSQKNGTTQNYSADVDQKRVQFFGEETILGREARPWSIVVKSTVAVVVVVKREDITDIFGSVERLLREQGSGTRALLIELDAKTERELDKHNAREAARGARRHATNGSKMEHSPPPEESPPDTARSRTMNALPSPRAASPRGASPRSASPRNGSVPKGSDWRRKRQISEDSAGGHNRGFLRRLPPGLGSRTGSAETTGGDSTTARSGGSCPSGHAQEEDGRGRGKVPGIRGIRVSIGNFVAAASPVGRAGRRGRRAAQSPAR